jgi:hypothetical protein
MNKTRQPHLNQSVKGGRTPTPYLLTTLLWMLFSSMVLTVLIWLPTGFNLGGLIEEWGYLNTFERHGVYFVCDAKSPIPTMQLRPLMIFPYALAYVFDPNSFRFYHIFLMSEVCLKCFAFSWIAWILTKSSRLALFSGMLLVLYPADTMQLNFRVLGINLPLTLILFGTICLLYALEWHSTWTKVLLTAMAACMAVIAVLMYEASLPLAPLPFIILFIRMGFKPVWRLILEQMWIFLSWIASFLACIAYEIYVFTHHVTYESSLGGSANQILLDSLSHFSLIFSIGFVRSLSGGWFDAFGILGTEFSNYGYLIFFFVALLILICLSRSRLANTQSESVALSWPLIMRLIGSGFLLIFLGYLPTFVSYAHLMITQRTYLFSSPGACLVWLGVILALFKISRFPAIVIGGMLLLAGGASQLFQFDHYNRLWNAQRSILRSIVDSFPSTPSRKTLIIMDDSDQLNGPWMFGGDLDSALSYIYHQPIHVEIVFPPYNYWNHLDSFGRFGQSVETPNSWQFFQLPAMANSIATQVPKKLVLEVSKKDAQIVRIAPDGSIPDAKTEKQVISSMNGDEARIMRYHNLLQPTPPLFDFHLFPAPLYPAKYRWDFGRWWNLDLPTQGTGWRDPEWDVHFYHHVSFAWKMEPVSTLLFKLYPEKKPYLIDGKFANMSPNTKKENVRIKINGHDIPLNWTDSMTFNGEVDPTWIQSDMNELEFAVPEDINYCGLSVALDWVSLSPK